MTTFTNNALFRESAQVYDLLYRDKDYLKECDFLETIFKRFSKLPADNLLDLGCGTGSHAVELARRGYQVRGVDRSAEMVGFARRKGQDLIDQGKLDFAVQDITDLKVTGVYDAIMCMFAVLGYQARNSDLFETLKAASRLLKPGGLLICDFWYGPAVLKHRPSTRSKVVEDDGERVIRIVNPEINTLENVVTVNYQILHLRGDQILKEVHESHRMRYLFRPEIAFFLKQVNLELVHFCPFMQLDCEPTEDDWNVSMVARAE